MSPLLTCQKNPKWPFTVGGYVASALPPPLRRFIAPRGRPSQRDPVPRRQLALNPYPPLPPEHR